MSSSKIWQIKTKIKAKTPALRREEIFKNVLKTRNIKNASSRRLFLNPKKPQDVSLKEVGIKPDQVRKAKKLIKEALEKKIPLVVYGDYDTDGICATAIVWETLQALGAQVMPFIPDRELHGYGLSVEGIKTIKEENKYQAHDGGLIITVDNGIVAHEAIEFAKKQGFKIIITDHHQKKETLPGAEAIIHTTKLSGSGVAYFLIKELVLQNRTLLNDCLELTCVGAVADMMPLLGVNRSIVKFGLKQLKKTRRVGLRALYQVAGVKASNVNVYMLSYLVAPRINAMGRISESLDALRLLCTHDKSRALKLAQVLDRTNRLRQGLTEETFLHAQNQVKKSPLRRTIFVHERSYNQGIIGLVAGKLVDAFYRPAIVTTIADGFVKGSARSIKGFNIIRALRCFEKEFIDLGGHEMAAGFSIKPGNLKRLEKKLSKFAEEKIKEEDLKPKLQVDCEIKLQDLTLNLFFLLEKLAPFGLGNRRPVFVSRSLEIVSLRRVGREQKHLKFTLDDPETRRLEETLAETEAIAFGFGPRLPTLKVGDRVDVVYNLDLNTWNNQEKLQLKVKDIKVISN